MAAETTFFSYSRTDSTFVKLAKDLRDAGADIWLDQLDIKAGSHWDSSIENALNTSTRLLAILSPASVGSNNVMDEISYALESNKVVISVLLNLCATPFRLRRLQRIDFTGDYQSGLNQLLEVLGLTTPHYGKTENLQKKEAMAQPSFADAAASAEKQQKDETEAALWENAKKINTISVYRKYLNESVIGLYKEKARQLIKELEDEQKDKELEKLLWEKAKLENTLNSYRHYIQEYPAGIHNADALSAIKHLEESINRPMHLQSGNVANTSKEELKKSNTKKYILITASFVIVPIAAWWTVTQNNGKPGNGDTNPNSKITVTAVLNQDSTGKAQEDNKQNSITRANEKFKQDSIAADDSIGIGRPFRGGIIFSIDNSGMHGLMAYPKDLNDKLDWDDAKTRCTGLGDGWRLPDLDELTLMYRKIGIGANVGGFQKMFYWSSRENGSKAYGVYFNSGGNTDGYKNLPKFVRPVRSF